MHGSMTTPKFKIENRETFNDFTSDFKGSAAP